MTRKVCFVFLLLSGMFCQQHTKAQIDCDVYLTDARSKFENGLFNDVIGGLNECIKFYNDKQKQEAFRILALSHLQLREMEEVDRQIRNLLTVSPHYQKFTLGKDPLALSKLILQYDVVPHVSLGIYGGPTLNQVKIKENLNLYSGEESKYIPTAGYHVGLELDMQPKNDWIISLRTGINGTNIRRVIDFDEYTSIQFTDNFNWLHAVLGVSRFYDLNTVNSVFTKLHVGGAVLTGNNSVLDYHSDWLNVSEQTDLTDKNSVNKFQLLTGLEFGWQRTLNTGDLRLSIGHTIYQTNIRDRDRILTHLNVLRDGYISDITRFRSWMLTLSYHVPLTYRIFSKQQQI